MRLPALRVRRSDREGARLPLRRPLPLRPGARGASNGPAEAFAQRCRDDALYVHGWARPTAEAFEDFTAYASGVRAAKNKISVRDEGGQWVVRDERHEVIGYLTPATGDDGWYARRGVAAYHFPDFDQARAGALSGVLGW